MSGAAETLEVYNLSPRLLDPEPYSRSPGVFSVLRCKRLQALLVVHLLPSRCQGWKLQAAEMHWSVSNLGRNNQRIDL